MKNDDKYVHPYNAPNEEKVNFVFNLEGLDAKLDREGNLTVALPYKSGPMFDPEMMAFLALQLGERKSEILMDEAAGLIQHTLAADFLVKRMR